MSIERTIRNVNRTVGTMLGSELTRRWGRDGLPDDTIRIRFTGSAGQSFGAFVPRGISLHARGRRERLRRQGAVRRNDHRSSRLARRRSCPRTTSSSATSALYGATSGEAYIRGVAGERFAVRNSGAVAVVEGVGDHGCEYMTGGRVRRARQDGTQLRRGHERRRGVRARRERARSPGGATPSSSISSRSIAPTTWSW
mgnify:CR=1 FL=1